MKSDLPLLDNLFEYIKEIMLNCTIKNPKFVNLYENEMSTKLSSNYMSILKGSSRFESFSYTYKDFYEALNDLYSENEIIDIYNNKNKLPDNIKSKIYNHYKEKFLNNYIEVNEYYRELNGDCNFKRTNIIYLTKEDVGDLEIDISKPVHEMSVVEQDMLYSFRIIDKYIEKYKDYRYLQHLGSKKKSIFELRNLPDFALISIETEVPEEIIIRFKENYEANRRYILKTVYSDAFKCESEYFEEFMIMLMLTQTAADILCSIPDIINKKEIFDLKTIKLFFNSIGVEYFPKIPYKYQMAMVRNFHRLLINKSTTRSIIDILDIFKMKNIEIFQYYLCKRRKLDVDNNYIDTGDIDTDFKLQFLKIPVDTNPDDYIHNDENFVDYDDIVDGDQYWKGDLEKSYVDDMHMNLEINYVASKYLSVDVMNDINEMNFQLIYFYNMLYDSLVQEDKLVVSVPFLSSTHKFRLIDIFSYLTSLSYIFNGFEDTTTELTQKVMYIKGFNFETDMNTIVNDLNNNKMTWESLGITKFLRSDTDYLTPKALLHIFNNNIIVLDELVHLINNAENKTLFDIYTKIYDSLFTMELNDKFYKNTIGFYPKTHYEFLSKRDAILAESIANLKTIDNEDALQEQISLIIEYVVFALQAYIPDLDFTYIFKGIPTVSSEAIQEYLLYVINFFKSFKTQILNINSKLHLNDKLENKINIVDDVKYSVISKFGDFNEIIDKITRYIILYPKEKVKIDDKVYFEYIYSIIEKYINQDIKIKDILKLTSNRSFSDKINIHDNLKIERVD